MRAHRLVLQHAADCQLVLQTPWSCNPPSDILRTAHYQDIGLEVCMICQRFLSAQQHATYLDGRQDELGVTLQRLEHREEHAGHYGRPKQLVRRRLQQHRLQAIGVFRLHGAVQDLVPQVAERAVHEQAIAAEAQAADGLHYCHACRSAMARSTSGNVLWN